MKHRIRSQQTSFPKHRALFITTSIIAGVMIIGLVGAPAFRLVGASVSENGSKLAIVENIATNQQAVVEPQDIAFGEAKVIRIENGFIELEVNGKRLSLKQQASTSESENILEPKSPESPSLDMQEIVQQLAQGTNLEEMTIQNQKVEKIELSSLEIAETTEADVEALFATPDFEEN